MSPEVPPDWQRHVEWINVLSQNLMAAANDLRPVQVRQFTSFPSLTNNLYSGPGESRDDDEAPVRA